MADAERVTSFHNGELNFDAVDSGPLDGQVVVLLHGFPQTSASWDSVRPLLNERGYRTVAPDQRGYSPGARPARRRDYRMPELVGDVVALIDALDVPSVHLVGHDWGAAVAWATAARSDRVRTLTALSVPHPGAFLRSMVTSTQLLRSYYMLWFQLPALPEWVFGRPGAAEAVLRWSGQSRASAERDAHSVLSGEAITGALNWYRALPLVRPGDAMVKVGIPTAYVWSDKDSALGRKGAELTKNYVTGPYEFRVLNGISHWIPEEAPEVVAETVDALASTYPVGSGRVVEDEA
jgi:pimeloyl-ACP methyl ester carboxylesterase